METRKPRRDICISRTYVEIYIFTYRFTQEVHKGIRRSMGPWEVFMVETRYLSCTPLRISGPCPSLGLIGVKG